MTSPYPGTSTAAGGPLKNLDPRRMSATTLGDVTWICADNVATETGTTIATDSNGRESNDIWLGAFSNTINDPNSSSVRATCTNDDFFTIWVRSIVPTTNPRDHKITIAGRKNATAEPLTRTMSIETQMGDDGDENTLKLDVQLASASDDDDNDVRFAKPSATNVAAHLSYLLTDQSWNKKAVEATSLDSRPYAEPSEDLIGDGFESILCKWSDLKNGGALTSISLGGSGADSTAGTAAGDSWASICWKEVPAISDLPPNSFKNHTVKVGSTDIDGGFHARFVSDDETISEFSNNVSFGNNTMVSESDYLYPRKGHWEEYCAVGTNRRIKSRSMPLFLSIDLMTLTP